MFNLNGHAELELAGGELRQADERLRAVIDNMREGVVIADLTGQLFYWNRAALDMHGFASSEEWCRRLPEFLDLFELSTLDGQVVSFEDWPMSRLLRGERLNNYELRVRRRDVDWQRIFSYGGDVVLDAAGRQVAFCTMIDITERKRSEESIAKCVERLRILHQIDRALIAGEGPAEIAAAALEPLRELLEVPRAVVNLFDLANREVEWLAAAGRKRVHVGPGVRYSMRFMGDVEALRRGGLQFVYTHALPPGPEVDALLASGVHAYVVAPMIARGELIGALSFGGESMPSSPNQLSIAQEVAAQFAIALAQARLHERLRHQTEELEVQVGERRQAESALRSAQLRLQQVITSSPAVLCTLALEGNELRVTWISENVSEMLGYAPEEVNQPGWWRERVHPEDLERTLAELLTDLLGRGRLAQEYRVRRSDGSYRWLRSEMRLRRTGSGHSEDIVSSWSDITERKQLEDQFRQAQKMEAVGRLAGGVAHDFNNLLTVINGYSEMVAESLRPGDPLRELVTEIKSSGERAATLTRQLLAFSRKQVLVPVSLDLNAVLAEMERMLGRLIGEDVELKVTPASDLWPVKVDAGQIEQVVMNLVVNARDAMPKGGKLTIETTNVRLDETYVADHPQARAGRFVLLAVTDTGCGMDALTKARVFEPFFSTKGEKGTGLGLSTVYGIVKQSGGHVEVYSELGMGTTFKVYLPEDQERVPAQRSLSELRAPARGTETILLAEDEDGVRGLARRILEGSGYTVLDAKNGGEALMLCERHQGSIHLLVTDVVMPGMSGRQLAERLAPLRPNMKVLYLSGYTDDAIVRHGILEPGTQFLQKPFSPAVLLRKVREVFEAPLS